MKNRFIFALFGLLLLSANSGIAANINEDPETTRYIFVDSAIMGAGLSQDFNFPPNKPQVFSNPLFWEINATCVITSANRMPLGVKGIKKTSRVNSIELSPKQDEVLIYVENGDKLTISADGGAEVRLINLGDSPMQAHCSM